jgi:hypothetical protein
MLRNMEEGRKTRLVITGKNKNEWKKITPARNDRKNCIRSCVFL